LIILNITIAAAVFVVQAMVVRVGCIVGWYLVMRTNIEFLWDSKSPKGESFTTGRFAGEKK